MAVLDYRHTINIDSTRILQITVTDDSNTGVDPTTVTLIITKPDTTTITKNKGDLTNPSTGVFQYRQKFDATGEWTVDYFVETTSPQASETNIGKIRVV